MRREHAMKTKLLFAALAALVAQPVLAADTLKLAIGQRGLWDSSIAEINAIRHLCEARAGVAGVLHLGRR